MRQANGKKKCLLRAQNRTKHIRFKELEVVLKTYKHYMEESWVASRMEAWSQVPGNP